MTERIFNKRGFSLLESTAALLVCLPVLLGTLDVFHIFKTQAVLKEATKLTLRHVSVTHGSGVSVKSLQTRNFAWFMRDWRKGKNGAKVSVAGTLPEGVVPTVCQNPPPGQACERSLINSPQSFVPAKREISVKRAAELYVQEEIRSALPQAIFECANPRQANCVTIEVLGGPAALAPSGDATLPSPSPERSLEVRVSYNMPLLILPFAVIPDTRAPGGTRRVTWRIQTAAQARVESSALDDRLYVGHTVD
ncbi:MAG: hypothetical protein GX589_05480 [Deltaproteobacteria bacterium]|nr:hypothetical protein [Deltaproteobacteria bacterium]